MAAPRRSCSTSSTTISASAGNSIENPTPITRPPTRAALSEWASAMIARPSASISAAAVAVARAPARSGTRPKASRLANTASAKAVNTLAPPPTPSAESFNTTNPARAA